MKWFLLYSKSQAREKTKGITSCILNKTAFFNLYVTFTLCVTFDLSVNLYSGCKTKNKE